MTFQYRWVRYALILSKLFSSRLTEWTVPICLIQKVRLLRAQKFHLHDIWLIGLLIIIRDLHGLIQSVLFMCLRRDSRYLVEFCMLLSRWLYLSIFKNTFFFWLIGLPYPTCMNKYMTHSFFFFKNCDLAPFPVTWTFISVLMIFRKLFCCPAGKFLWFLEIFGNYMIFMTHSSLEERKAYKRWISTKGRLWSGGVSE